MNIQINEFSEDYTDGVIELLREFWDADYQYISKYFNWRFLQNPLTDTVFVSVASVNGRVVGIRTSMPVLLGWGNGKSARAACICESFIVPDFRGGNTFSRLSKHLEDTLRRGGYDWVLNFSAIKGVQKFSVRQGWNTTGTFRVMVNQKSGVGSEQASPSLLDHLLEQEFDIGDTVIRVSEHCYADQISEMISSRNYNGRFFLQRDADSVSWQYSRPEMRTRYLYMMDKENTCIDANAASCSISGFLVLSVNEMVDEPNVWITDWEGSTPEVMLALLEFLVHRGRFKLLFMINRPVSHSLLAGMMKLGFNVFSGKRPTTTILSKKLSSVDGISDDRDISNPAHWEHRASNLVSIW